MAKGKLLSALALIAALPVIWLTGCGGRTTMLCDSTVAPCEVSRELGTRATIAILPFHYERDVPESLARIAGERLTKALSSEMSNVLSPSDVLSLWKASYDGPWKAPRSASDFRSLRKVIGGHLALHGVIRHSIHGHIIPSKFEMEAVLIDLSTGKRAGSIRAWAKSTKGLSYSGRSSPPEGELELLDETVETVKAVVLHVLNGDLGRQCDEQQEQN
ncbi:MAG: hypothetical protein JW941_12940 [Candidatus Coatesbacteria bacterium]|nr:hypothetical protein [Candidatus Coatesbacteria bacterium]